MKRVLLLTEFFPPSTGGIQRSLEIMTAALGSHLTVVTPQTAGSAAFDAEQHYTIIRRSLFSGQGKPSWWWLLGWLFRRRSEFDLIIFGHFSAAVTAAWLLRRFLPPYVVLVHGMDLVTEQSRRWPGRMTKHLLRGAVWIGVNSSFTANLINRQGIPKFRIVRTHPAVNDEILHLTSAPTQPLRLVTVCRLVPRKNVSAIIRAIAQLIQQGIDVQYDVVGEGPERPNLEQLARTMNLDGIVKFHGHVSDTERDAILNHASLAVMAPKTLNQGRDVEGLGAFYLEAAARGLPLVASANGGIGDIVIDGQTGIIVDADDVGSIVNALKTLMVDEAARRRLGQAAKELVKKEYTATVRNGRAATMMNPSEMRAKPLISMIIPSFNSAISIGSTLESVFAQTWPNIEVIVVNDGSSDNVAEAVKPWRKRVTYIEQTNQGAPAARNRGAKEAHGDFLLFIDADTILKPSMIEKMLQALLTHPEAAFAYSNFRFGPKGFRLWDFSGSKLKKQNYIHTSSLLRRSDFPGFDESLKRFQDWDLWLTLAEQKKEGIWVSEELFSVSQRAGGISAWVPRFVYRLPFIGQGKGNRNIAAYRQAEAVIRQKHGLV